MAVKEYHICCLQWLLLIIFMYAISGSAKGVTSSPMKPRVGNLFSHRDESRRNNSDRLVNRKTHLYNQTLDHFNYRPESYRLFQQKLVIVDDFWGGPRNNAPIFVFLGAEEPIDSDVGFVGFLEETAPLFHALVVYIEHRYYGMSNPNGSMQKSLKDPDMRGYFNSAQALADYAEIILFLKKQYQAEYSPVFVFGGSYGGMLATWFRLKYPHVAMGALASSAPIFMSITAPDTYDNWVNKVYRETSRNCYETIGRSWGEIVQLGSNPTGLVLLSQKFNTCSTLNSSDDLASNLVNQYRIWAQFDRPPNYPVSELCRSIDEAATEASDLDKVAASVVTTLGGCLNIPSSTAPEDQTTLGWGWQICGELVDPMSVTFNSSITNSVTPVTPFALQTFVQQCNITFGVPTRPFWLHTYYGARDLRLVLKRFGSNIIFSNGLKDPFSQEEVLESISETIIALKADEGAHYTDLLYSKDIDPGWLTEMRKKEVEIIKGWLSVYYADLGDYLNGS